MISLGGKVVAEGKNSIWVPEWDAGRHAEMEALRRVPPELRPRLREMTLYTTLEPCLMCAGAILLHHVGRIVFGSFDSYGGAGSALDHLSPYFEAERVDVQWMGPALPEECDPLFERVLVLVQARRQSG